LKLFDTKIQFLYLKYFFTTHFVVPWTLLLGTAASLNTNYPRPCLRTRVCGVQQNVN